MKKQLSYKAYLKNYFIVYLFLALLVFICYAKEARGAFIAGESEMEWQQENMGQHVFQEEGNKVYYCLGGDIHLSPYNVDNIIKKVRQLYRGCSVGPCGLIANYYYTYVVQSGLWFGIILIILSQLPYGTRKSREFLVQLPLTAGRRYCYETLTNAVIVIGIPILVSFVTMLVAMIKGYGWQDFFEIAVYMVVISLFCFSFLTMFKEFHRNPLAGTLWGVVVLMMFLAAITDIIEIEVNELEYGPIPQWFAVLLSVGFLFTGRCLAEGKRMEQPHAIRFLFVRLFMVACFIYPNVSGILTDGVESGGMFVYEVVITVLWAIAFYALTDLKYIGKRIEDLFHPSLT